MIAALVLAASLTGNAAAQSDFNHGLLLCYAYNGEEATRYFGRALVEDPHFAMAAWGNALAAGPDLNTTLTERRFADGANAMARAVAIRSYASPTERAYIDAMALRFRGSWRDHESDDAAYRTAMAELADANPGDGDAQVLAAEVFLEHNAVDKAKPFVERALAADPGNVMANHLCIHLYDDASDRSAAIPCARRLDALDVEPAAEHLAHMPAHVWIETGNYTRAVSSSRRALALFDRLLADGETHVDHQRYVRHDTYIGYSASMMDGNYATALALAARAESAYAKPFLALTALRFGRDDDALHLAVSTSTPDAIVRAWIIAERGDWAQAAHIASTFEGDQATGSLADLARARIAETKGDLNAASQAYDRAQAIQHRDFSAEVIPLFPAETERGAFLLRLHKNAEAEIAFKAAIARYPNDPRALYGLALALGAQHKLAEAESVTERYDDAWASADTTLNLATL